MKIEFEISEEDLLTHQLFATSKSKSVRNRRSKGRLFLLVVYMIAGFFVWNQQGAFVGALFFLACIPLYFLYARLEAKQYLKHFRVFVKEQMAERNEKITILKFTEDEVTMADGPNESTIPLTEIVTIYEIPQLYSLSLSNGQSIVLPKNHSNPAGDTNGLLRDLAEKLEIPYIQDMHWKWK